MKVIIQISFITVLVLSLNSCKKDKVITYDDIQYRIFDPEVELTSVSSWVPSLDWNNDTVCLYPSNLDSTVSYALDLDQNNVSDFIITVWHNPGDYNLWPSYCNIIKWMTIESTHDNNSIAVNYPYVGVRHFQEGEVISNSSPWDYSNYLQAQGYNVNGPNFEGESYIGLRIKIDGEYRHGWLKVHKQGTLLKLISSGFNFNNDQIIAGQIE